MKNSVKAFLILSFSIILIWSFFAPRTTAQEWTYDGANTERIPGFSVYPSECYISNITGNPLYFPDENYTIMEVLKANITEIGYPLTMTMENGTLLYGKITMVNATSGEKWVQQKETGLAWWNESIGYYALPPSFIPVGDDGKVTEDTLNNVSYFWSNFLALIGHGYEYTATYPKINSYICWNETYNLAYWIQNFTETGILKNLEHFDYDFIPFPNITLMSVPAQEPPDFSFTTDTGSLTVNSTEFKLNISVTDADNNNDGKIDTDYLYRIQNGTEWSNWTTIPNLLDWDLGNVEAGSYDITVEVKNMYGVTQKEITIEYEPPKKKPGIIPSYPIALISIIVLFSISIIIHKYRKKLIL